MGDGPDHPGAIAGGDYFSIPECTAIQWERLWCHLTCSATDPSTCQRYFCFNEFGYKQPTFGTVCTDFFQNSLNFKLWF